MIGAAASLECLRGDGDEQRARSRVRRLRRLLCEAAVGSSLFRRARLAAMDRSCALLCSLLLAPLLSSLSRLSSLALWLRLQAQREAGKREVKNKQKRFDAKKGPRPRPRKLAFESENKQARKKGTTHVSATLQTGFVSTDSTNDEPSERDAFECEPTELLRFALFFVRLGRWHRVWIIRGLQELDCMRDDAEDRL